ncbi:Organic solute transporter Ost-alpha [Cynara cardunculus var. scolymus]|uniref:Organic solute transporter Ost-alpha n=1 Tax=Cynara cardunculus var. scolymus TaxID=59895 RepID=A0A103Y499_CYNCS|nr:Organic solute transporter Ost-alpha [Cynara cardunculus var. scolymus]
MLTVLFRSNRVGKRICLISLVLGFQAASNIYDRTLKMNHKEQILIGSAACVMITITLSLKLLIDHLLHWKKPKEQKAIVVIILMAPIYAIDSYVGLLVFRGNETFFELLDSIKECYEGLVMAKFLALLYTYLDISMSMNISHQYLPDVAHIQQAMQNGLVIVEMIFFSIFQMYAYSADPYKDKVVKQKKKD